MQHRPFPFDWQVMYALNIGVILLVVAGFLPREILLVLGTAILYFLGRATITDGFFFCIASMPFFVAMPITPDFDSLALWRLAVLILFVKWFWMSRKQFRQHAVKSSRNIAITTAVALLATALIGISVSSDPIAGLKSFIYILNGALIFPVAYSILSDRQHVRLFMYSVLIGGIMALIIGYSQLILAYLTTDGGLWSYWAHRWSYIFYGDDLSRIVLNANTWFSYYPDQPPTLRMFSTFTDAHAFGLYALFAMVPLVWHVIRRSDKAPVLSDDDDHIGNIGWTWTLIAFFLFSVILSGTRGLWLGIAGPILFFAFLFFFNFLKKNSHAITLAKVGLVFIILIPISSLFLAIPQFQFRSEFDSFKTFKRFSTVTDIDELSNKSRIAIWQAAIQSIGKHPMLGVGLGNFPVVLEQNVKDAKAGSSAHNLYLNIATEMGLPALILVGFLLLILARIAIRMIHLNSRYRTSLTLAVALSLVWAFTYSIFDIALLDARVFIVVLSMIALLCAQRRRESPVKT